MTAWQRGWLLPPASLILVAGIFLGRGSKAAFLPLVACVLAVFAALLLKGWGRFAACMVFSFALGICAGNAAFHPRLPPEGDYNIHGVICDEVTAGSFSRIRVYLSDITLDGCPLSGKAYWTFYANGTEPELQPGMAVSFRGSLYHPQGAANPNGYNFRESLLQRGVTVGLYGGNELVLSPAERFSFFGTVAAVRHHLYVALSETLGEETGAYASALLLGMRSIIPSGDRQAFSRLGIAHILSVSGFHVGVLIGVLAALFRLLKLRQGIRLGLFALILFCYAALCGMSQPVIRASLLLLLNLEGRILNRHRSGIHLLCAALFIMALLDPVQVTSASFQLSFCAMFGLIWFSPLTRCLRSIRWFIPRTLLRSLMLTFGVQLGLLFPELLFFQRLPLLVFVINLPAMLVSGILVFLFWIVLLLLPFPVLSGLLSGPLSACTEWLLSGIRSLGSLPGLSLWIHSPDAVTALAVILIFASCCPFLRLRHLQRICLSVIGTVVLIISLLPVPHSSTEYIQFSVGNADASVLWDKDKVYVIDTGEDDGTVSAWLRTRRLTPDAVLLTHLHTDHAGGLRSLVDDEIPVRLILLPAGAEDQDIHPDIIALLNSLRDYGTEIRYLSRGDVISLPSGRLTVLWPEIGRIRSGQDANNYSLVCRIVIKDTVMLQTGDLTGTYERYCSSPADLLKAAHHGSASSTAPEFLSAVSPGVILLSCQRISRLQDFRKRTDEIPVYGTPESGAVTVRFEEGGYTVIPFITD